ncbi:MAG: AAA-like domain-containing protein [Prochloraceae cyanobacterium]
MISTSQKRLQSKETVDPTTTLNLVIDLLELVPKTKWVLANNTSLGDWEKELVKCWSLTGGLKKSDRELLAQKFKLKPGYLKTRDSELRQLIKQLLVRAGDEYEDKRLTNKVMQQLLKREIESCLLIDRYEGMLPLNSRFYISRSEIEYQIYNYLNTPYNLLKLEGERKLGKTSLIRRILQRLEKEKKYQTVYLDFSDIEPNCLDNFDLLAKWFAVSITDNLNLRSRLAELWDEENPTKINLKNYFEISLAESITTKLILCLDRIDTIFNSAPGIDFLTFLRSRFEQGKENSFWNRIRFILIYSEEIPKIGVNNSPFNVGSALNLPLFEVPEIMKLATKYSLNWGEKEASLLREAVGGKPYLIRHAFRSIVTQKISIDDFVNSQAKQLILAKDC